MDEDDVRAFKAIAFSIIATILTICTTFVLIHLINHWHIAPKCGNQQALFYDSEGKGACINISTLIK